MKVAGEEVVHSLQLSYSAVNPMGCNDDRHGKIAPMGAINVIVVTNHVLIGFKAHSTGRNTCCKSYFRSGQQPVVGELRPQRVKLLLLV